jgi:hypothetical protein
MKGFSCTTNCNGSTFVFMGVRPPQTAGSDVICWTAGTPQVPTGDQLWSYDTANRLLINQVNYLALKRRTDGTLEVGTTATDGSPVTLSTNIDATYTLVFDDGNVVGLGVGNCPGALYSVVTPGTSGYQTAFGLR